MGRILITAVVIIHRIRAGVTQSHPYRHVPYTTCTYISGSRATKTSAGTANSRTGADIDASDFEIAAESPLDGVAAAIITIRSGSAKPRNVEIVAIINLDDGIIGLYVISHLPLFLPVTAAWGLNYRQVCENRPTAQMIRDEIRIIKHLRIPLRTVSRMGKGVNEQCCRDIRLRTEDARRIKIHTHLRNAAEIPQLHKFFVRRHLQSHLGRFAQHLHRNDFGSGKGASGHSHRCPHRNIVKRIRPIAMNAVVPIIQPHTQAVGKHLRLRTTLCGGTVRQHHIAVRHHCNRQIRSDTVRSVSTDVKHRRIPKQLMPCAGETFKPTAV